MHKINTTQIPTNILNSNLLTEIGFTNGKTYIGNKIVQLTC